VEAARRAEIDDVGALVQLCRVARAELAPLRGGALFVDREARGEPLAESFTAALADSLQAVWLGTIDGTPVGYAAVRLDPGRDGSLLAVIDDLFVEQPARAVGVGEALMAQVMAWADAAGAAGIDAIALPGARDTKNFFEETGFTARQLRMHHPLSP